MTYRIVVLIGMFVLVGFGCDSAPEAPVPEVSPSTEGEAPAKSGEEPSAVDKAPTSPVDACLKGKSPLGEADTCLAAMSKAEDKEGLYKTATTECDGGNANGCMLAGQMVRTGTGTGKDLKQADVLLQKACDGKNLEACVLLGLLLKTGKEFPENYDRGAKLLATACIGQHPNACNFLGMDFLESRDPGIRHDGVRLLQKACNLGHKGSCRYISTLSPPPTGGDSAQPVVKKYAGIEWVVDGALAGMFDLKGVTCKAPFRGKRWCALKIHFPQGWQPRRHGRALATVFDGAGVQVMQMTVTPSKADPGVIAEQTLQVDTSTRKVVIQNR